MILLHHLVLEFSLGPFTTTFPERALSWIQGPNGSGKTTLLKTLAGLRAPQSGTFQGVQNPLYLSHQTGLHPALKVSQQLKFWKSFYHTAPPLPFDLPWDRTIADLSEGETQRLNLTRLAFSPQKLWLLDEPLRGLDHAAQEIFMAMIDSHLAKERTALVSSHHLLNAPQEPVFVLEGKKHV